MASIQEHLNKILSARYGRDVRQSIHDSIETMNKQVEEAENSTLKNATIAKESAISATASETNAKASEQLAEQYKDLAFAGTPEGYEQLVENVALLDIQTSTEKTLTGTPKGGLKINSIDGANEQISYSGNNLLPYPFADTRTTVNGVTFTQNNDGTLNVSGTSTGTIYYYLRNADGVVEGQYFLSGRNTLGVGMLYAIGSDEVQYKDTGSGVSLPNGYNNIVLYIGSGVTVNGTLKPMLNSGDSAMEFEPYVGGIASPNPDYPQEIESVVVSGVKSYGRNVVNWGGTFSKSNVSSYTFENDTFSLDYSGAYANVNCNVTHLRGKRVKLDCESITNTNTSAVTYLQFVITRPDGTKKYEQITDGGSLTLPSDATSIRLQVMGNNTSVSRSGTLTIKKPLIHIYGVATAYEPYKETSVTLSNPITLNGIGEVKDQIIKKDGVWGVSRKLADITLDGSEDWEDRTSSYTNNSGNQCRYSCKTGVFYLSNTKNIMASIGFTKFITGAGQGTANGVAFYSTSTSNSSSVYVTMNVGDNSGDLERFTDYLHDNPLELVYELATPTFEPLPIADQLALNSLGTFDTVTNIIIDSPVEPNMEVEYGTSKVGGYTLQGLLLAENNALKLAELTSATLTLNQE